MENENRKSTFSKVDLVLEIFSWALTMGILLYTILVYTKLPIKIPTHFNGMGEVDGYGSPATVFYLVIVLFIMQMALSALANFPQVYNYPVKITEQNREAQFRLAKYFIRTLKLCLAILFTYIQFSVIYSALSGKEGMSLWFLPIALIGIFGTIIIYFVKAFKVK